MSELEDKVELTQHGNVHVRPQDVFELPLGQAIGAYAPEDLGDEFMTYTYIIWIDVLYEFSGHSAAVVYILVNGPQRKTNG